MAHLFNNTDYCDYRSKSYNNIKKTLETKIDVLTETASLQLHPMNIQEDIIDGSNFNFNYDGQTFTLPRKLLEVPSLADIINI